MATSLDMVKEAVVGIMECPAERLEPGTRLVPDLGCESIDLMEIAIRLSQKIGREVDDDALFLRSLRVVMAEAPQKEPAARIVSAYPWLGSRRAAELARELERDPATPPLVTVQDMADYLDSLRD